jgi:hypothetical protein
MVNPWVSIKLKNQAYRIFLSNGQSLGQYLIGCLSISNIFIKYSKIFLSNGQSLGQYLIGGSSISNIFIKYSKNNFIKWSIYGSVLN